METPPVGTCSYYIKSKSRSCKFPRCGDSAFCGLHRGVQRGGASPEGGRDGGSESRIVPCLIDGRHFVSADKLRSHIRKCSRVRDVAYELSQPFCMHACGPPRQLLGLEERLRRTAVASFGAGAAGQEEEPSSEKRPVVSEERLEFVERLHGVCEREFGRNPHLEPGETSVPDSGLNRHELQAVSISRELRLRTLASPASGRSRALLGEDSLVIEFGAGNAVLSHWLIKECGRPPREEEAAPSVRCVIIDRESRRKQMEKLGGGLICPIRLRLDIEQFDIKALISACNDADASGESIRERMYSGLGEGGVPWVVGVLLEQGIWVCGPSGEKLRTAERAAQLGREELKRVLAGLSRGGGPEISSIEERFVGSFAGRPVERLFVVSKHLCGNGFDLGLRSSRSAITEMKSGSVLVVAMSPCCHHRCSFPQHLGAEMLREHVPAGEAPFEGPEDCFRFLASISSWSTGAKGRRSELGYKAKYILDSCRLFWLRNEGFTNIVYSAFTSKSVSPENILVTAIYVKK